MMVTSPVKLAYYYRIGWRTMPVKRKFEYAACIKLISAYIIFFAKESLFIGK